MNEHEILLNKLLEYVDKKSISKIMDAGSGKTSLSYIVNEFPNSKVDAVIYYNDDRKKKSIIENITASNYNLLEMDIVKNHVVKEYDLVLAHLLLGEAEKFGNNFEVLLEKLLEIKTKYLIIIDIKEDPSVDYSYLEREINQKYKIIAKCEIKKEHPQQFENFISKNYVGYVIFEER